MEEYLVIEQKHIPERAFEGRTDLVRIRLRNVWSVGPYAFSSCPNLQKIVCENGPAVICEHAFDGCEQLERIAFSSSLRTIGEYAFYGTSLRELDLPGGISLIGNSAFQHCRALQTLAFPPSLREIGASAFSDCGALRNIDLGSVQILHDGCFANTAPEKIMFPASVSYIGRDAFSNCADLKMAVFADPGVRMRGSSFIRCENLKHAVFLHREKEEHRVLPRPLTQKDLTVSLDRFDRLIEDPVTAFFRLCFPYGLSDTDREKCLALVKQDPGVCSRFLERSYDLFTQAQKERLRSVAAMLSVSFPSAN